MDHVWPRSAPAATAKRSPRAFALARNLERGCARTSATFVSWFCPHVNAGIFLQRNLLYVCACVDAVLRRAGEGRRWLSAAVRDGKRARAAAAWASVRHDRGQTNDYRNIDRKSTP